MGSALKSARSLTVKEVGKAAPMRVVIWSALPRVFGSRLHVSSCAGSGNGSSGVEIETRVVGRELRVREPMHEDIVGLGSTNLTIAEVFVLSLVQARVNGNGY